MANENSNDYNGYRFLLDAKNSRQYAIRYENGRVKPPLQVFAGNVEDGGFKPNEKVYAFDDDVQIKIAPGGKATASTVAYQITTDETGRPRNLKQIGVEFDVTVEATDASAKVKYTMTPESVRKLADPDNTFDTAFPKSFSDSINPKDPGLTRAGGTVSASPALIQQLPFPPHHDGEAFIARLNIDKTQGANTNTFNTAANPAIPEPPKNPKITSRIASCLSCWRVQLATMASTSSRCSVRASGVSYIGSPIRSSRPITFNSRFQCSGLARLQ